MSQTEKSQSGLVVKNTLLNLLGATLPLLVGILTIPYVVRGLGMERFGILSLAWVIFGYFAIFDFGLGRATTKFVAEAVGEEKLHRVPTLIWTSVIFQIVLGVTGGIALAVFAHYGLEYVLEIPPPLLLEAKHMLYVFCFAIPVSICAITLRGALEAAQRFDLVTVIRVFSNSSVFLMPAIGLLAGFHLPGIAFLLLVTQVVRAVAFFAFCIKVFPILKQKFSFERAALRPLFSYGGWVTVYTVIIPLVMYLDRFFIGTLLSLGMVAYFTIPYDAVSRIQILPSSLAGSLFPALSTLGMARKEEIGKLYAQAMRYLLVAMGSLSLFLVLFAGYILDLWLGSEIAEKSTVVLQVLVVGFFLSSLAWPPTTVLLSIGRPDLVAKLFFLLLLIHAGLTWVLIHQAGIVGAAWASVVRGGLQVIIFFVISWRVMALPASTFLKNGFFRFTIISGILVGTLLAVILTKGQSNLIQFGTTAILGSLSLFVLCRYVLDTNDWTTLWRTIPPMLFRAKGSSSSLR